MNLASLLAPALAARSVSMAAAGTDLPHRIHFWRAVERYRRDMMSILNRYITTRSRTSDGYSFTADREVWALVPPFQYLPPTSPFGFPETSHGTVVVLLWLLLSLTFAGISARALPVED